MKSLKICFFLNMSYYNLAKRNFKFFMENLNSDESDEDSKQTQINETNSSLTGGSNGIKYNVIDFDWDDIEEIDTEDIFLSSTSKELIQNNKPKIKEPSKDEVYDEILNKETEDMEDNDETNQFEQKYTGEMTILDDDELKLELDDENEVESEENNLNNTIINEIKDESEDKNELDTEENSDDNEFDLDDNIIHEYFSEKNNKEDSTDDLGQIDDIIQNYFECFENIKGGQNINKIKDVLSQDEIEYKKTLTLTGGNFKPIVKSQMNKLYPYVFN